MIVVSPVVVVVAAEDLYPPSPPVAGQRCSRVWSLTYLMFMVVTFMSPPPKSNFTTTKVLRLPDVVTFGPIYTSKTVLTRTLFFSFAPQRLGHSASEVTSTALVSILVPMLQHGSGGAIVSIFFEFFKSCIFVP